MPNDTDNKTEIADFGGPTDIRRSDNTAADLRTQLADLAAAVKPEIEPRELAPGEMLEDASGEDEGDPEMRAEVHEARSGEITDVRDPRVVALENLCVDVRSFFGHLDAIALDIVADLKDPTNVPTTTTSEATEVRQRYINTLRDLYALRTALDEYKVHTAPAAGSEYDGIWADYSDRIFTVRELRKQLTR